MIKQLLTCVTTFGMSLGLQAASFEETASHLDTDGQIIGYVDFSGDSNEIGDVLNQIWASAVETNPEMPPIPLDFINLLSTLGYGNIESMGLSSLEIEDGLVQNKSVMLLDGEPTGVLRVYGLENRPFYAAQVAPSNVDLAMSGEINLSAYVDTIVELLTQVMGPMGEGMAGQYLASPVPGTEITLQDLIETLSAPGHIIFRQDLSDLTRPVFDVWVKWEGAGSVLDGLLPMAESMGIMVEDTGSSLIADLSPMLGFAGISLFLEKDNASEGLFLYTSRAFDAEINSDGSKLVDSEAFQTVTSRLPSEAAMFTYSKGMDLETIYSMAAANPEMEQYMSVIKNAGELVLGDFSKPSASAMFAVDGGIAQVSYSSFSYKQMAMIVPVAVAAAVSFPAFENMKKESEEKEVRFNLHHIASAADQYTLDTGEVEMSFSDLVGEEKYLEELEPVVGENYEDMVINRDESSELSVTLPDGRVVSIDY